MSMGDRAFRWLQHLGGRWEERRRAYRGVIFLFDDFQIVILFLLNLIYGLLVVQAVWVRFAMGGLAASTVLLFLGKIMLSRIRPLPLRGSYHAVVWSHYSEVLSEASTRSAQRGKVSLSYHPFVGPELESLIFGGGFERHRRYAGDTGAAPDIVICDAEYLSRLEEFRAGDRTFEAINLVRILRTHQLIEELSEAVGGTPLEGALRGRGGEEFLGTPLRWGVNGVAVCGDVPSQATRSEAFALEWLGSDEAIELKREGRLRVLVPASTVTLIQILSMSLFPNHPTGVPKDQRERLQDLVRRIAQLVAPEDCVADPLKLSDVFNRQRASTMEIVIGGGNWLLRSGKDRDRGVRVFPVGDADGVGASYLVWCEVLVLLRERCRRGEREEQRWRGDAEAIVEWMLQRQQIHRTSKSPGPIHSFPACLFGKVARQKPWNDPSLGERLIFPAQVRMPVRGLPPSASDEFLVAAEWEELFSKHFGKSGGLS